MASRGPDDADDDDVGFSEINITPLTDIFLVLLIIFMVTSTVLSQSGIKVSLPKASSDTTSVQPDKGITVAVKSDGSIYLNEKKTSLETLTADIQAALPLSKDKLVVLEGDEKILLGTAVIVMDKARKAGAQRFAIATKSEK
ncbi:MAG: biopolymer transporter ExbD [Proteobacteria bacterium]|jgi:biopolymer transport protein ExbD|nr:biopolymer transporter ExbD [Pseudomonadota bacterium]